MSLYDYAKSQMDRAWPEQDEMQDLVKENVLELIKVFAAQGHSGFSANYVLGVFDRLAHYKPIAPLKGTDDEWMEVGEGVFQNKFAGSVFKDGKDGQAYWMEGKVFKDKDGCYYTNMNSRVYIDFPWTMPDKPEIVEV